MPIASNATQVSPLPLLSPEQFNELLGLIYEGPHEAVPWTGAMRLLHQYFDASWVSLLIEPKSSRPRAILTRNGAHGPEVFSAVYDQAQAIALDPFVSLPTDRVATIDEVMDTRSWISGEPYKRYIGPNQIRYILGSDIHSDDCAECRLRITRPSFMRDFSEREKLFCQMLMPHLRRSMKLRSRVADIDSERRLYAAAMDRMQVGVMGVDAQRRITYRNAVADAILAEGDGVLVAGGKLRAEYAKEDAELNKLIGNCYSGIARAAPGPAVAGAVSLTRSSGQAPLGVLVRADNFCATPDGRNPPQVAVFIRDPRRQPNPSRELVGRLFGFTAAETPLALLLAKGATIDEAAQQLDICRSTARAHLRSIFHKTGVTRQAVLVSLLLNSVMSVG